MDYIQKMFFLLLYQQLMTFYGDFKGLKLHYKKDFKRKLFSVKILEKLFIMYRNGFFLSIFLSYILYSA